jgi:hypothetical protein
MADTSGPVPSGRVFISYRRQETAYAAGWLYERLRERLGSSEIFKDIDSLSPGDDFANEIHSAVGACDVLLALIGADWITITDETGRRRIDDPADFVRLEIEAALSRDVRVIPLLIAGAGMPRPDQLPAGLRGLIRRHALELSPARFESDTRRLIDIVEETLREARRTDPVHGPTPAEPPLPDAQAGSGPGPSSTPAPVDPLSANDRQPARRAFRSRRLVLVATVLVLFVLTAAGAVFITRQQRDSGSAWRMEIAAGNAVREGCTVTLTNPDTGERRSFEGIYGTVSHQLLDQGRWTWTVSDPRCVVTEKSGAGAVTLPFVQRAGVGDSDAFRPDGPISVTMLDDPNGGTSCDLELRSVKTGKILAFRTVVQGGPPATLDPAAEAQVYIASNYCSFRAAPSR